MAPEELKLKLGVDYTPKMQGVLKAKKWLKRFGYIWLLLTFWMAISLVMDARANPELWHVVETGESGEELKHIEDALDEVFVSPGFNFSNFSGIAGIEFVGDDLKYKYPDWVYQIQPESSYQHFYETIRWPVGAWVMLTFLFMGLRLRVSLWEIKNLRGIK